MFGARQFSHADIDQSGCFRPGHGVEFLAGNPGKFFLLNESGNHIFLGTGCRSILQKLAGFREGQIFQLLPAHPRNGTALHQLIQSLFLPKAGRAVRITLGHIPICLVEDFTRLSSGKVVVFQRFYSFFRDQIFDCFDLFGRSGKRTDQTSCLKKVEFVHLGAGDGSGRKYLFQNLSGNSFVQQGLPDELLLLFTGGTPGISMFNLQLPLLLGKILPLNIRYPGNFLFIHQCFQLPPCFIGNGVAGSFPRERDFRRIINDETRFHLGKTGDFRNCHADPIFFGHGGNQELLFGRSRIIEAADIITRILQCKLFPGFPVHTLQTSGGGQPTEHFFVVFKGDVLHGSESFLLFLGSFLRRKCGENQFFIKRDACFFKAVLQQDTLKKIIRRCLPEELQPFAGMFHFRQQRNPGDKLPATLFR